MEKVCIYMARMALVMQVLPWGTNSRGLSKSEIANALARKGIDIHKDSLLRNLKEWQPLLGLECRHDAEGTSYWKRGSRHHGFAHMLDLDEVIGEPLDKVLDVSDSSGLDHYELPDWASDIIFHRR